jgi:hypothetical protein
VHLHLECSVCLWDRQAEGSRRSAPRYCRSEAWQKVGVSDIPLILRLKALRAAARALRRARVSGQIGIVWPWDPWRVSGSHQHGSRHRSRYVARLAVRYATRYEAFPRARHGPPHRWPAVKRNVADHRIKYAPPQVSRHLSLRASRPAVHYVRGHRLQHIAHPRCLHRAACLCDHMSSNQARHRLRQES